MDDVFVSILNARDRLYKPFLFYQNLKIKKDGFSFAEPIEGTRLKEQGKEQNQETLA